MSDKRSDRLRSIIAATVTDAAEDAAPVTITGSSISTTRKPQLIAPLPETSRPEEPKADRSPLSRTIDLSGRPGEAAAAANEVAAGSAGDTQAADGTDFRRTELRAPQRPIKPPKWEKVNFTLEPRDRAILEHSDVRARAYGFRIRKGGNPSLFVRAGLRLLEELGDSDPEAWIRRIAATTQLGLDNSE